MNKLYITVDYHMNTLKNYIDRLHMINQRIKDHIDRLYVIKDITIQQYFRNLKSIEKLII